MTLGVAVARRMIQNVRRLAGDGIQLVIGTVADFVADILEAATGGFRFVALGKRQCQALNLSITQIDDCGGAKIVCGIGIRHELIISS